MPLQSELFKNDPRLQRCLIHDPSHVKRGASGDFVHRIQVALTLLDGLEFDSAEILSNRYGRSTAAAVLKFKQKRNIVNRSYQSQPDDIVGKITIAALDGEMVQLERTRVSIIDKIHCRIAT